MATNLARVLRPVEGSEVVAALLASLSGGPPLAPLPAESGERARVLAVLRPDEPVAEPDTSVVLTTSGSTAQPKGVILSRSAIRASVAATHARLGGPGDWALALPTHYVAGLMVLARAVVAGTTVVPTGSDLAELPAVAGRLDARRYISLVPTQLVRALRVPRLAEALSGFRAVLLGGGPADDALLATAREHGIRVVTTYGMSETCGGCVYDGRPLDGIDVSIDSTGRVAIGGPTVFSGYRLRPDLTAAALVDGRFRTEDRGRWRAEAEGIGQQLEILGRLDDVVISGGHKVDLTQVERRVRDWARSSGADGVALALPDPEWGTMVVAVCENDGTLDDLRAFVRRDLPDFAAPRRLIRLAPLPRLSSGKPDRLAIRSAATSGLAAARPAS